MRPDGLFQHLFLVQGHTGDWVNFPFGPGHTGSWLASVAKFALIGAFLALIILFLRVMFGPGGPLRDKEFDEENTGEEPLEILKRRLAEGEITPEEYEQRKRLIEND